MMTWFKKVPFVHLPVSVMGGTLLVGALLLNALAAKITAHYAHSVSELATSFIPCSVAIWVVYGWIARNTSN